MHDTALLGPNFTRSSLNPQPQGATLTCGKSSWLARTPSMSQLRRMVRRAAGCAWGLGPRCACCGAAPSRHRRRVVAGAALDGVGVGGGGAAGGADATAAVLARVSRALLGGAGGGAGLNPSLAPCFTPQAPRNPPTPLLPAAQTRPAARLSRRLPNPRRPHLHPRSSQRRPASRPRARCPCLRLARRAARSGQSSLASPTSCSRPWRRRRRWQPYCSRPRRSKSRCTPFRCSRCGIRPSRMRPRSLRLPTRWATPRRYALPKLTCNGCWLRPPPILPARHPRRFWRRRPAAPRRRIGPRPGGMSLRSRCA
jgi:hypothetical protein